jgi:hypothetical protein
METEDFPAGVPQAFSVQEHGYMDPEIPKFENDTKSSSNEEENEDLINEAEIIVAKRRQEI